MLAVGNVQAARAAAEPGAQGRLSRTSQPQVVKEFRRRGYARYQQMIAGAGAGNV
jgi:hypothetical protein